ncbi:hypothetical protein [Acinetobacter sp. P1(2025)]|uniref:hypothetical protein n=1 Tax=Acinetobacter sp. P1(2025) TaxID=3446120 RepID=UPI003F5333CE
MNTESLKTELNKILTDWFKDYTSKTIPAIGMGANSYKDIKEQVFGDLVGEFMRNKWGQEWQENDEAQAFYENTACDLRGSAEDDMQEWINNFGEFNEKVTISDFESENIDENLTLIKVKYQDRLGDEDEIYINLDQSETGDDDYRKTQIIKSCFTQEDQEKLDNVISGVVYMHVLSFIPNKEESLFGVFLNDYGIYKYTSEKGDIAVVCHKYHEDLSFDDKSIVFNNEAEFDAWYDEMKQDDHHGDASIVSRAIKSIEGNSNVE